MIHSFVSTLALLFVAAGFKSKRTRGLQRAIFQAFDLVPRGLVALLLQHVPGAARAEELTSERVGGWLAALPYDARNQVAVAHARLDDLCVPDGVLLERIDALARTVADANVPDGSTTPAPPLWEVEMVSSGAGVGPLLRVVGNGGFSLLPMVSENAAYIAGAQLLLQLQGRSAGAASDDQGKDFGAAASSLFADLEAERQTTIRLAKENKDIIAEAARNALEVWKHLVVGAKHLGIDTRDRSVQGLAREISERVAALVASERNPASKSTNTRTAELTVGR
jgi:hypothetical protein